MVYKFGKNYIKSVVSVNDTKNEFNVVYTNSPYCYVEDEKTLDICKTLQQSAPNYYVTFALEVGSTFLHYLLIIPRQELENIKAMGRNTDWNTVQHISLNLDWAIYLGYSDNREDRTEYMYSDHFVSFFHKNPINYVPTENEGTEYDRLLTFDQARSVANANIGNINRVFDKHRENPNWFELDYFLYSSRHNDLRMEIRLKNPVNVTPLVDAEEMEQLYPEEYSDYTTYGTVQFTELYSLMND